MAYDNIIPCTTSQGCTVSVYRTLTQKVEQVHFTSFDAYIKTVRKQQITKSVVFTNFCKKEEKKAK